MPKVDYVEGIELDLIYLGSEANTLQCLAAGLAEIYQNMRQLEGIIRQDEDERRKRIQFLGFGFLDRFGIDQSLEYLIPCYFHWFSTSLCNYVRLVGFCKAVSSGSVSYNAMYDPLNRKAIKDMCDNYINSIDVLSPIVRWRNKVSAHFAITAPLRDDTEDDLASSSSSPLEFQNRRFRVGTVLAGIQKEPIGQWSITETFEALAPRYWPEYGPRSKPV